VTTNWGHFRSGTYTQQASPIHNSFPFLFTIQIDSGLQRMVSIASLLCPAMDDEEHSVPFVKPMSTHSREKSLDHAPSISHHHRYPSDCSIDYVPLNVPTASYSCLESQESQNDKRYLAAYPSPKSQSPVREYLQGKQHNIVHVSITLTVDFRARTSFTDCPFTR
jgi:hypothetical protein